jgi:hypothetical protein
MPHRLSVGASFLREPLLDELVHYRRNLHDRLGELNARRRLPPTSAPSVRDASAVAWREEQGPRRRLVTRLVAAETVKDFQDVTPPWIDPVEEPFEPRPSLLCGN